MAKNTSYPRPRITRVGKVWRVTYADNYNMLWTREFAEWDDAVRFALGDYNE